jgi:hypothetical protein
MNPQSASVGPEATLRYFSGMLEHISNAPSTRKTHVLSKFIDQWRQTGAPAHAFLRYVYIFLYARLLLPNADRLRQVYALKEVLVAKIYVSLLELNVKTSPDAEKLISWQKPAYNARIGTKASADFATVLEDMLVGRGCAGGSGITIKDLNDKLDEVFLLNFNYFSWQGWRTKVNVINSKRYFAISWSIRARWSRNGLLGLSLRT